MATPIRIKRSAVAGKRPTDLHTGELALNTFDAEIYTKRVRPGIGTDIVRLGVGATVPNVLYVTKDGNDNNTGKKLGDAKATIAAAVGIAEEGTVIKVSAGTYLENNPISLPNQVSIVGDSLREVSVTPQNQGDLFLVGNGNYVAEMSFVGSANTGAIFAFNKDQQVYNNQSPYIQNCTNFIPNSIGLKIDGRHSIGPTKSMVVDSYTQYNQGGIGCSITNNGYAQLVSMFTICNDIAVYAGSGGQCDLTNSNSSFGNFGLVSDGVGPKGYTGIITQNAGVNNDTFIVDVSTPELSVFNAQYNNITGIATITTELDHHFVVGDSVYLSDLQFTCPPNSGTTSPIFPSGKYGYVFEVKEIPSANSITVNVGPSTITHTYDIGGTVKINVVKPYDGQVVYFNDLYYSVGKIKIINPGSGYTKQPTVTISSPSTSNEWGITASAVANIASGSVTSFDIVSSGRGYSSSVPSVEISAPDVGINTATAEIELLPTYYSILNSTPISSGITTITVSENVPYEVTSGMEVPFYRQSRILASSHAFEYIGSGTTMNRALPSQGGVVIPDNEVDDRNGGLTVFTSTDQTGNFKIGDGVIINQQTGTISGTFYSKSLFSTMTPFILALGGE